MTVRDALYVRTCCFVCPYVLLCMTVRVEAIVPSTKTFALVNSSFQSGNDGLEALAVLLVEGTKAVAVYVQNGNDSA